MTLTYAVNPLKLILVLSDLTHVTLLKTPLLDSDSLLNL